VLRPKKTLSNWLTTRYQLIIRNEENFAEKTSVGFTYSKVVLFSVILFTGLFTLSLVMSKTILARWFDPKHEQMVLNQQLYDLHHIVDSLILKEQQREAFVENIKRRMNGDTSTVVSPLETSDNPEQVVPKSVDLNPTAGDSAFRKEYEQSGSVITLTAAKYRDIEETFFYTPLTGFVSDGYNARKNHLGVDIVAKANEPVKCIADGMVIFSSWTQDSGYVIMVQHRGNLISAYKHNAQLLKKVGTFVNGGEIISIVGNSGELTNGPHLHFELWHNGNSLNPEEFIKF
jgi:murein DD-endopeptidase MepM/ murein hydrolase activator NlpD